MEYGEMKRWVMPVCILMVFVCIGVGMVGEIILGKSGIAKAFFKAPQFIPCIVLSFCGIVYSLPSAITGTFKKMKISGTFLHVYFLSLLLGFFIAELL